MFLKFKEVDNREAKSLKVVIQRVSQSSVTVEDKVVGSIDKGLTVLLGVGHEDTGEDINYLVDKILNLRIFEDEQGKMNLSLMDVGGQLLIISQFTIYGDCRKGRRPSFINAAPPQKANELYLAFAQACKQKGVENVQTGEFGAHMKVSIVNDGPVTLLLDSRKKY